jgi:hypothetical protein
MSKVLNEETSFNVSIKTLIGISAAIAAAIAFYYTLKQEIEVAKQLPEPAISRTEYDLKDQMVRDAIMQTQKDVHSISKDVKIIDERLYEIQKGKKR